MAKTLEEALVAVGVVNASNVKRAQEEAQRHGTTFLMALVSIPGVDADLVGMMVARHFGLPYSHLMSSRVARNLIAEVSLRKLRTLQALPIDQKGLQVTMAAADPGVKDEVEALFSSKGLKISWVVVPVREMESELGRLLLEQIDGGPPAPRSRGSSTAAPPGRPGTAPASRPGSGDPVAPLRVSPGQRDGTDQLDDVLASGDAPAIVEKILSVAVDLGASDVHVVLDGGKLAVRLRKDGVLRTLRPACSPAVALAVISRIKIVAELDITENRMPQDGRARVPLPDRTPPISVLMRVSTVPSRQGEKVTLRILEKGSRLLGLKEVGLSRENHKQISDALLHPNGIVLVTGPTGSGKTTTVYAVLQHLISDAVSVFTLEDPIEYELAGTYQCQVHESIGLSFPVMLRSILRQDPNVMLVGEMRDPETAKIAFEAGLTGHFVISTLHANSATTAITRLLEMEVEPFVMGTCTRAIVAQRLVRTLCACKRPVYRMPDDLVQVKERLGVMGSRVYEPAGCVECAQLGYNGRVAIHEVLTMDAAISDLILARGSASQVLVAARANGFRPMVMDGFSKVLAGLTTASEVIRQIGPPTGS